MSIKVDSDEKCVECVESQEWTYGIDNTGTRFNDVATYCLVLSDGSTVEWSQNGSSTSWPLQLTEWATNIQAAADAAGLAWIVEPRYVDNPNPTNIDGTINGPGGTPSGLPGAPSIPIALSLIDGGMAWRYVNFQICPGQPVPTRAFRKTSQLFDNNPFDLTAAGAILGPLRKFWICADCGKEPEWYLEDGKTEAEEGQIPNCWEPCGTLALADAPPDRDCTFEIDVACDNNNSNEIANFTNTITRRATICNGEQIAVDYFQADPADPAALAPYTLAGDFVDCASGIAVEPPTACVQRSEYIHTHAQPGNRSELFSAGDAIDSGIAGAQSGIYKTSCGEVAWRYQPGDSIASWSNGNRIGFRNTDAAPDSVYEIDVPEGLELKVDLGNVNTGESEWFDVFNYSGSNINPAHTFDGTRLSGPQGSEAEFSEFTWTGGTTARFSSGTTRAAGLTAIAQNMRICYNTVRVVGCICDDSTGEKFWQDIKTGERVSECDVVFPSGGTDLTHVVHGCVKAEVDGGPAIVKGFTIVDNNGNPLFDPKPLAEIGFIDCCPDVEVPTE